MGSRTNAGDVLAEILSARRRRLADAKEGTPPADMERRAAEASPPRDFRAALSSPGLNVIAECKKASPSQGLLRAELDPAGLARGFEKAGACALSVLTEPDFFQGSTDDLRAARAATSLPVLCKDFLFDPYQLLEARAAGADAFLLIAVALSPDSLREMIRRGNALGMTALVETHTAAEIDRAVDAGAGVIGVNNRDLKTMEVRIETSFELAERVPRSCRKISESGLSDPDDLRRLRAAGYDAFLIGTTLMRTPDPAAMLAGWLKEQASWSG